MLWDGISVAVKALSDNIVAIIKEFHLEPEAAIKLELAGRQALMDFQRQLFSLEMDDRKDARKRETDTKDPTVRRLAYTYTLGYFLALFASWHWGLPVDGHDVFVTLLGVLTAAQAGIISYYFGSSHSSANKEAILDRVINHKETQ
jgi:hypothetical protein